MKRGVVLLLFLIIGYSSQAQFYTSDTIPKGTTSYILKNAIFKILVGNETFTLQRDTLQFDPPLLNQMVIAYPFGAFIYSGKLFSSEFSSDTINGMYKPIMNRSEALRQDSVLFEGLEKRGAITRGIGFGDLNGTSQANGINLSIGGKISNDFEVRGVITDNNLPFQPDGSSFLLQDFDRAFLQIKSKQYAVTLGDYDLTQRSTAFLNTFKNTRGIKLEAGYALNKDLKGKTLVNLSLSRGLFGRNTFFATEGIQGPYPILGNNNEIGIVILAASERVYYDGVLMKRGEQYDYIMDYNAGTIRFTPNRLITNKSRIIVEFEYFNQLYARGLVGIQQELGWKNHSFNIQYYTESDFKNNPFNQSFSKSQIDFLSNLKGFKSPALFSGEDSLSNDTTLIRYHIIDTLGFKNVYVKASTNSISALKVSFVFVGSGKGDYIITDSIAVKRTYQWIQPIVNGNDTVHLGAFVPGVLVPVPNARSLLVTSYTYTHKYINNVFEFAVSNNDSNLFANNPKFNGYAFKNTTQLIFGKKEKISQITQFSIEQLSDKFRVIQPLRNAEFARDWNIPTIYTQNREFLVGVKHDVNIKQKHNIGVGFNYFDNVYNRTSKYYLTGNFKFKDFSIKFDQQLSRVFLPLGGGYYFRPTINANWNRGPQTLNVNVFREDNSLHQIAPYEKLDPRSFRFNVVEAGWSYTNDAYQIGLKYNYRDDYLPLNGNWVKTQAGHSVAANTDIATQHFNVKNQTTLRKLITTSSDSTLQPITLLNQTDLGLNLLNRSIVVRSFYASSTGKETIRQFTFIQVTQGLGTHIWIDYNGDGIQQLDEFEIAVFSDQANFIKVLQPGFSLVNALQTQFNYDININANKWFKKSKFLQKTLGLLSVQSFYSLEEKRSFERLEKAFFRADINDSLLISGAKTFKNAIFINRSSTQFGLDFYSNISENTNTYAYGLEQRKLTDIGLRPRISVTKSAFLEGKLSNINRQNTSDLPTRNFTINGNEWLLRTNVAFSQRTRVLIEVNQKQLRGNAILESVNPKINSLGYKVELYYSIKKENYIKFIYNYINNRSSTLSNQQQSPIYFELLQGLQTGRNNLWSVVFFQKLSSNMMMNASFDYRVFEKISPTLAGRAQIRYMF